MRVLVVGSGGREHALAWACARREGVELICAPGNAGTATLGENVEIAATDAEAVATFAAEHSVDLVVVGPDAALEAGVVDACEARGLLAFGPTAAAARLETSKLFAKEVMRDAGIPTARWVSATAGDREPALRFITERGGRCVVKADGLAAGKGVTVCDDIATAEGALREALDDARFGAAGERVIVEERLEGREVSVFAICDGERARLLPPACDYKRAYDGDAGPNTGGMGAYSPPFDLDAASLLEMTARDIVAPCLRVMRERGTPFRGCLYVGLMLTAEGPSVLEFNARFGDPETQALLPLLDEDVVELLSASARGDVASGVAAVRASASVCVVVTTDQYPRSGPGGAVITLPEAGEGSVLFHAGTATRGSHVVVSGGRVLNAVAYGATVEKARAAAYELARGARFETMRMRTDIALPRVATVASEASR